MGHAIVLCTSLVTCPGSVALPIHAHSLSQGPRSPGTLPGSAEAACRAGYGDIGTIRTQHVVIDGGIPAGADQTKAPDYQLGVASDAGKAPGHRPPRRHRGFYLVMA